ncbi:ImmA/IrrE family metallo-endopeptidase [Streptomyces sp. ME02-6979.5a]|uniref:helix-turn-helix domain-containing protein n=1 Tax=Streptomyces sp. ME02-6979.5a TaxID=462925 RepID=UPI0029B0CCEE|nr:ImmA/IrrE family metallo-endopeptidase [Streptomyces sp. ME02-6979.5a]MDX3339706.1 ImmA/IrrE family metallo-endopeptidase [Streptomyces sp. ME02-6979.5a]
MRYVFTPERLLLARQRRRMTLAALAKKSSVSAQSITAFENGRKQPSEDSLTSLADALGYPSAFFYRPAPVELTPDAVSFRAPSKMTALERDSALSSGAIAAELNMWLEERFKLPEPNLPTFPHRSPTEAAAQVRAAWGLGEAPVVNMVHLLESNGVRVFSLAPDCLDADAFSTIKTTTPFVFLNTRKTGQRGRFDAAHELGHLVLHCQHRIPRGPAAEAEADEFASAFLMPQAGILAQQLHNASVERILSAKRKWGVSAMALTYRLRRLGLLSEWRYTQTAKELSRRGYRRGEPDAKEMARESSQLLAKVFQALRGQRISPQDVAADLDISPAELNEYVFGLVPVTAVVGTGGGDSGAGQAARPALRLVPS